MGGTARCQFANQEKAMTSVAKLALLAAFAAAGASAPAFAQSATKSPAVAATASHRPNGSAHHNGRLFDSAPQNAPARDADAPSATGGGSIGYNQMLYNW
jgi:hypothetical protein